MDFEIGGHTRLSRLGEAPRMSDTWRWIIAHQSPVGWRLMCYNCNLGRAKNNGICPHLDFKSGPQVKSSLST